MTQAELAKSLKKPQSFVSKLESGDRRLTVADFLDVATALGEGPGVLLKRVASDQAAGTILEDWDVTAEELSEVIRDNPSLRGITLGYIAEVKVRRLIEQFPALTYFTKFDDHDRKKKGDLYIEYAGRAFDIEVKSLRTALVRRDEKRGLWVGKTQVDASDRREVTFDDGSKLNTTLLRRGEFDVLAVNCFAFEQRWRFAFCRNSELPESAFKKYPRRLRRQLIASTVPVTWPPEPPFTSDLLALLDEMVRLGEGRNPETVKRGAEVVTEEPTAVSGDAADASA